VEEAENIWLGVQKHRKIEKVTGSQDDDFVGGLKKNTPKRLTLVGLRPGLSSAVPVRQAQGRLYGTWFS
jgi:hypothetical protein